MFESRQYSDNVKWISVVWLYTVLFLCKTVIFNVAIASKTRLYRRLGMNWTSLPKQNGSCGHMETRCHTIWTFPSTRMLRQAYNRLPLLCGSVDDSMSAMSVYVASALNEFIQQTTRHHWNVCAAACVGEYAGLSVFLSNCRPAPAGQCVLRLPVLRSSWGELLEVTGLSPSATRGHNTHPLCATVYPPHIFDLLPACLYLFLSHLFYSNLQPHEPAMCLCVSNKRKTWGKACRYHRQGGYVVALVCFLFVCLCKSTQKLSGWFSQMVDVWLVSHGRHRSIGHSTILLYNCHRT